MLVRTDLSRPKYNYSQFIAKEGQNLISAVHQVLNAMRVPYLTALGVKPSPKLDNAINDMVKEEALKKRKNGPLIDNLVLTTYEDASEEEIEEALDNWNPSDESVAYGSVEHKPMPQAQPQRPVAQAAATCR